jgi:hypothetical protein
MRKKPSLFKAAETWGGSFGFRQEHHIRRLIPDQSPQGLNCSRPRQPPAVPRQNSHGTWGGLAQPPFSSDVTTGSVAAEPILDFPFLAALNRALAGFDSMMPGL